MINTQPKNYFEKKYRFKQKKNAKVEKDEFLSKFVVKKSLLENT